MGVQVNSQFKLYFLCCYDSGVVSSILVMPPFLEKYRLATDSGAGYAIVPASLAASVVASFVSGFVADKLGRKKLFYVACIIHEIGCVVEIAGQFQASFFAGRIITGLAIGIYSMLVPLYQSEIAKPSNRGRLITFYQIFVTLGFCVAFWLGYGMYRIDSDVGWRLPVGLQLLAGFIMLCGLYFIPESPRWLIYKDRNAEALKILAQLRSYGNEHDVDVQMEFTGIVQDVSFDKMAYRQRFMSLLRKGNDNNRKRTLLGIGIHLFSQLSGINALLFYLPHILESAGIKEANSALLGNGVGGAVNFVATLFVLFYIDKWGRRRILVCGALAMSVCMICITIVSAVYNQQLVDKVHVYGVTNSTSTVSDTAVSYAILALLCVFIAFFALSWGPIGWIYPAEIYPQMIRANAMGVTTSFSYLFNLFISLISPIMFREIRWGTYLFFAMMSLIMASVVQKYYPETRGRSLEEIQLIFSGALIDQRPDAHHPATAAEALLHLEQIQHKDKRNQMQQPQFSLNIPAEWSDVVVSNPHNVSRALSNFNRATDESEDYDSSIREVRSQRSFATSSSIASWSGPSSIELDQLDTNGETSNTTAAVSSSSVPPQNKTK
ncbi:sugar transporter [Mucor ambiguus]|uniref:Sugar transporter n=1 Tax=Mucor ambiguus TaxID=91626 RepID=A0A0C9ML03_9FUNG|nr:sugar transporter [Mucor ambiguus]